MSHACTTQTVVKCGCSLVIQSASWTFSKNLSSSCNSMARTQSALAINPRNPPSATVVNTSTGGAVLPRGSPRVTPRATRSWLSRLCSRPERASNGIIAAIKADLKSLGRDEAISLRPLGGRQFTARETGNANGGKHTGHQQDDLREGAGQFSPAHAPTCAQRIDGRKAMDEIDDPQQALEDRQSDQVNDGGIVHPARLVVDGCNAPFFDDLLHGPAGKADNEDT